jgi:hypothetical protein
MAPSETSATGSMGTRLVKHTPACNRTIANDMVYGSFAVTIMMGMYAPNLTDLMGGWRAW